MRKSMAFALSAILILGATSKAFAWESDRKLRRNENFEMNRINRDERNGRISRGEANYLERDVRGVRAEENWLKRNHELSHRREGQLDRELRRDNQELNRSEGRGWRW